MKWNLFKEKAPPGKRWLSCLAMALALTTSAATVFAAPVIAPDAEYSQPRLGPNPVGHAWGNVVPNALADYFTYVPYATADATALGFPGTCGVSEDCYTITVKAFPQPLSLAPILGPTWGTNGLLGPTDTYFGPANYTNVFGYGSGGTGWTPPQFIWGAGNVIQKNLAPVPLTRGNAPTAFANFQFDAKDKGIWHFPAPSVKGTKGRPIRIQWLNELPNTIIPGLDPTVDCSDNGPNCFPYNRIVTHVHGAHVGPASDGLTQGDYNPDFSYKGVKFGQTVLPPAEGPPGTYVYPMDQEAATIWYHDHAAGNTHLNTNMGMAGFFPITDDNEKCLQGISHPTLCPAPTKVLPTGTAPGFTDSAYELGFALQDRVFYTDGQLAMPDAPVIDGNFPSCDQTSAASRLATCSPLFMYAAHAANADSKTPAGIHMVPYDEFTMDTTIPENANAPLLATSATLEFFGNMPVVNGVVYGRYDVEPRVYRMRFLGGTDSRTWDLQLEAYDAAGLSLGIIPFWQIGSEQGFLNNPVSRSDMLLLPGERLDTLVDFAAAKALYPTMTKVMLNNLGTDAPFQGEQLTPFNRSVDIPEIMQFNLIALGATPDVPAPNALLNLRPAPITPMTATPGVPIRKIALEEIVDEYQRIMPTIDRRGYDLPGMQATEIVRVNDTEIWDLINTTADAHPMHLHQVAFQVVHRQPFTSFTPAINDIANGVFSQANYTVDNIAGPPVPPDPHDAGFKDTVYTPPGFVTRVIARFDLVGEYVWHCHILSHEEHDMMRPLKVVASALNPPVSLTVPATAPDNRTITVTVAPASPANPVAEKYYVEYKKPADANWTTNSLGSGTSQTFTLPSDGTYNLRVKAVDAAISPTYSDSTYTLGSTQLVAAPADQITSPANNSVLGNASQTFTFSTSGPYSHYLWVGTTGAGSSNLGRYTAAAGVNSIVVNGLPLNGSTIYVRLWVKVTAGAVPEMRFRDYTYTSSPYSVTLTASVASPQLTGTTVTLTATGAGGTGPYEYRFWINSGAGYVIVQNYSPLNTYAWTPVAAGNYDIMVDMRAAGSTVVRHASAKIFYYRILPLGSVTGVTLTSNLASPRAAGTPITFTALGQGGSGTYEYRFWINSGAGYTIAQNYGTANTFVWTPAVAGAYDIMVDVRNAGSTVVRDASAKIFFYRITAPAATGVTLTSSLASPQPVNTPITFTALGQGGSGTYEYRYWINSGAGYTIVRNYSTTNTFTWTPTATGAYDILVDVRNVGSTALREASNKILFYRIQ